MEGEGTEVNSGKKSTLLVEKENTSFLLCKKNSYFACDGKPRRDHTHLALHAQTLESCTGTEASAQMMDEVGASSD